MAETTGISWTDATFNPWIGCAKVSPGCDHCYAEVSTPSRTMKIIWGAQEARKRTSASNWHLPVRWNNLHDQFFSQHGRRRRVFCASLSDVFDNQVNPQWREDLWTLIRETPNLDWLLLTKRIGNVAGMLPSDWGIGWKNVWLGASMVNQAEYDRDKSKLAGTHAHVRFISFEPLLSAIDAHGDMSGIHWAIVGGESGPKARTMPLGVAESLHDQCKASGVAFYFKQHGGAAKDKGGCILGNMEYKAWPLVA